jgi:N-acyl-D-amino-acid deacylase
VRTRGVVSLPEAIRKMTSLAAHHMGMSERGVIAPGAYADLVLFDPQSVIDRATPDQPHAVASGISKVWVNGVLAYDGGRVTGQRAGRRIYRGSADGRGEDRR